MQDRSTNNRVSIRDWLWATAILTSMVVVFLWTPLTSNGFYAPGDLSQSVPLLRTAPSDFQVGNMMLGDVSSDIVPWKMFNREQIRDGRLPLWNPYNESGVPHLANAQSEVFSPFNLPFFLLPLKLALIASVALGLLTAGLAT